MLDCISESWNIFTGHCALLGSHHKHQYLDVDANGRAPNVSFGAAFTVAPLNMPCTFNLAPDGSHGVSLVRRREA